MALGFDIWKSVVTGYTTPTTPPIDATGKNPSENNAKSMNVILCGLSESKFVKVMHCKWKNKFGTSFKISMKEMTRLRRKISKLIEDSLRV
jgi:hypothetical protein